MIEINLLPEEYRQKKRVPLGERLGQFKGLVIPAIGVAAVGFIIIIIFVVIYPYWSQRKLTRLNQKWESLEKDYEEVKIVKREQQQLQAQLKWTGKIIDTRVLWAPILNAISDDLPPEIQLTELITREEKRKDVQPKVVLVVNGLVPDYPGERAIEEFVKNLQDNKAFKNSFPKIMPPATQTTDSGNKTFTLKCYLSPKYVLEETKPKKKKGKKKVKS